MTKFRAKLLLCEGAEDSALVRALVHANAVPDNFDIRYIGEGQSTGFGVTGLRNYLQAMVGLSGFNAVKKLGLLVDNDMAPPQPAIATFIQNEMRAVNQLPDVHDRYSVPTAPNALATNNTIDSIYFLIPSDTDAGCLETLLVEVLNDLYPDAMNCVEGLLQCAGGLANPPAHSPSKKDKARVRAAISILCPNRPQTALSSLWDRQPNLIPVTHAKFSPLTDFLSNL